MELRQLEHLLAVVDSGTFTRAAERLGLTQPAVSFSIRKLEEEACVPLFARGVHELSLTEAGIRLTDYARRIIRLRDEAFREMARLGSMTTGSLSICAHEAAAVYLLPAALRTYVRRFPQIKVNITRACLDDIARQVMNRQVDIGFVRDESPFHELRSIEVYRDETICIASPRHPLASHGKVTLRDLSREAFVQHQDGGATNDRIRLLFEQHSATCRIVAELWSFETIKELVRQEVGLAIVPAVTVRDELRTGSLVQLPLKELAMPRRTVMIFLDQGYVSDAARELIGIVKTCDWATSTPALSA